MCPPLGASDFCSFRTLCRGELWRPLLVEAVATLSFLQLFEVQWSFTNKDLVFEKGEME